MSSAVLYIFFCGVVNRWDGLLRISIALLTVEVVVFVGNGMQCPLTDLAVKYGAPTGHVGDTFLPARFTRYTFRAFGTLFAIGILLVLTNGLWR